MHRNIMFNWLIPGIVVCGSFVLVITAALLVYRFIRRRFPVHVNCWFCSSDTVVPYGNQNCWDCPECSQYNGFTKEGDYNKPIPAQHSEDMNYPVKCKPEKYLGCQSSLCRQCQQNQLLKIKQLAAFIPVNEDSYDSEISTYKKQLEKEYDLCVDCTATVEHELQKQDDVLRVALQRSTSKISKMSKSDNSSQLFQLQETPVSTNCNIAMSKASGFLAWLISSGLLASTLFSAKTACKLMKKIPVISQSLPYVFGPTDLLNELLTNYEMVLIYIGCCFCFLSKVLKGKERLNLVDPVNCFSWFFCTVYFLLPQQIGGMIIPANFLFSTLSVLKREVTKTSLKQRETLRLLEKSPEPCEVPSPFTHQQSLDSTSQVDADDLDLDFNALTVDALGIQFKRNDSGVFSSTTSLNSTVSRVTSNSTGARQLITPAKLRYISFSDQNKLKKHEQITSTSNTRVSQDNLFQLASQSTDHTQLFKKEYMQSLPSLKTTSVDCINFPLLVNNQNLNPFAGSMFKQSLTGHQLSTSNHSSKKYYTQNSILHKPKINFHSKSLFQNSPANLISSMSKNKLSDNKLCSASDSNSEMSFGGTGCSQTADSVAGKSLQHDKDFSCKSSQCDADSTKNGDNGVVRKASSGISTIFGFVFAVSLVINVTVAVYMFVF